MGHVLAVPEQAIVVFKLQMIHIMKPLDVSSMLKAKTKKSKVQFGTFWTQIEQTSHCDLYGGVHMADQNGLKSIQKI